MLRLFCYVRGDHYNQAFEVKIGKEESVSSLKEAIKEKKSKTYHEVDADSLVLWAFSVSYNESIKESVERLDLDYDKSLEPLDSLSDIFSSELEKKSIHVVVDPPSLLHTIPSEPQLLELNCLVSGDDHSHIFPVKILSTESVGALKDMIKEKKKPSFDHIPADALMLWKAVNTTTGRSLKENLKNTEFTDEKQLSPIEHLSEHFSELMQRRLHILIKAPPPAQISSSTLPLELNCLVLEEDHSHVFSVEISASKNVAALKKAIKKEKKHTFEHVDADALVLWTVSIPADDTLEEELSKLELVDEGSLSPVNRLSKEFSGEPKEGYLHIIVKAPPTGPSSRFHSAPPSAYMDLAKARRDWTKRFPSKAPSEKGVPEEFASDQQKKIPAFHFSRPPSTAATIPITLLDRIFAQFQEDCETYAPTAADHAFVLQLSLSMSGFYKNEKERAAQARADMGTYGLDFMAATIGSYITDGDLRWKEFCYALLEYKDEVGAGKAEPLFQVIWYYVAFMRSLCPVYAFSNLPCFILYAFGPYVGFAGAMWTDRPHLQVLAPVLPLFYHRTDVKMRERAARYFGAAKKAINALKHYYQHTLPSIHSLQPDDRPNPAFPYQREYTSLTDSSKQMFKYVRQLYADKLVFHAIGMSGNNICIKFVRQYSKDVHDMCSALGFAPTLQGFESLPGGWYMVVMDFVDDTYELLDDSPFKPSFLTEVREKLMSLHQAGYVHGDIRATNIMVKKSGEKGMMLLDFDWAGAIGEIQYPMNVNITDIRRPEGAIDKQLVLAEHDMAMIVYMFNDFIHQ